MQITKTVYKVSDFVSWQKSGSLVLSPSFQRRPVWKKVEKSYFVDTVVKGLPTPLIYVRERTGLSEVEGEREVVDGQQRLRTLFAFIDPALLSDFNPKLDSFEVRKKHNADISDRPFDRLSLDTQRQIVNYEFSTHILPSSTSDREVLQIFSRINSTGTRLNPQELRNAEFTGEFKLLMYELAREQLDRWRRWGIFDEFAIARMMEVEFTSEVAMLMHEGLRGKNQRSITKFYRDHEEEYGQSGEISRRFRTTMDAIDDVIGEDLEGLQFSRLALFHTLFTLFYDLLYGLESELKRTKIHPLPKKLGKAIVTASEIIRRGELPEDLAKALRGATSHRDSRKTRLDFLDQVVGSGAS